MAGPPGDAKRETKPRRSGASRGPHAHSEADEAMVREAAALSYEDALERLESLVDRLESGELGLEASLQEYRRGRALLQRCKSILDQAEQEIRRLSADGLEAEARLSDTESDGRDSEADRSRGDA